MHSFVISVSGFRAKFVIILFYFNKPRFLNFYFFKKKFRDRLDLAYLIRNLGAKYTEELNKKNTHLICLLP